MTEGLDRRIDERRPVDAVLARIGGASHPVLDLSVGGCRVEGYTAAPNTAVTIELADQTDGTALPGIAATVVAQDAAGCSLCFHDITYALMSFVLPRLK